MKLPNLGQGSVHGLGKLIHAALLEGRGIHAPRADDDSSGAGDEEAADDRIELLEPVQSTGLGSLLECFEVAAKMLREAEQHVWRSRLGFQCPQATLQELGDAMGLTRERIRQIERKAFSRVEQHAGWAELSYRLNRALKGRTTALFVSDLPALDPWFAEATSLTTALVGAVHQILPDRFDAFQIRGAWVVSHLTRHEWQEVCHLARSRLESERSRASTRSKRAACATRCWTARGKSCAESSGPKRRRTPCGRRLRGRLASLCRLAAARKQSCGPCWRRPTSRCTSRRSIGVLPNWSPRSRSPVHPERSRRRRHPVPARNLRHGQALPAVQ